MHNSRSQIKCGFSLRWFFIAMLSAAFFGRARRRFTRAGKEKLGVSLGEETGEIEKERMGDNRG